MFVPSKFNIHHFQVFQVFNVIKEKWKHNSKQHLFVSKTHCDRPSYHTIFMA